MKDQHKKITGYRELTQQEIDLMNLLKKKGEEFGLLLKTVKEMRLDQMAIPRHDRDFGALTNEQLNESMRCIAISKTEVQTGLMWAVQGVALPDSF